MSILRQQALAYAKYGKILSEFEPFLSKGIVPYPLSAFWDRDLPNAPKDDGSGVGGLILLRCGLEGPVPHKQGNDILNEYMDVYFKSNIIIKLPLRRKLEQNFNTFYMKHIYSITVETGSIRLGLRRISDETQRREIALLHRQVQNNSKISRHISKTLNFLVDNFPNEI